MPLLDVVKYTLPGRLPLNPVKLCVDLEDFLGSSLHEGVVRGFLLIVKKPHDGSNFYDSVKCQILAAAAAQASGFGFAPLLEEQQHEEMSFYANPKNLKDIFRLSPDKNTDLTAIVIPNLKKIAAKSGYMVLPLLEELECKVKAGILIRHRNPMPGFSPRVSIAFSASYDPAEFQFAALSASGGFSFFRQPPVGADSDGSSDDAVPDPRFPHLVDVSRLRPEELVRHGAEEPLRAREVSPSDLRNWPVGAMAESGIPQAASPRKNSFSYMVNIADLRREASAALGSESNDTAIESTPTPRKSCCAIS